MQNSADAYSTTLILKFTSGLQIQSWWGIVNSFYRKIILTGITPLNYKRESSVAVGKDYWLVSLLGLLEFVAYPRDILVTG